MKFKELIKEAELNRNQFKEVSRFKSGDLVYTVKMKRRKTKALTSGGETIVIDTITPDIAITLKSSVKRKVDIKRKYNDKESAAQRKIRDVLSNTFDRMYSTLTPEEIEKFQVKDVMPQILDVLSKYFKKYNSKYVVSHAYGDNLSKRNRFYDTTLKRLGYKKLASDEANREFLYSKGGREDIVKIISHESPTITGRVFDTITPDSIKTLRSIASNI